MSGTSISVISNNEVAVALISGFEPVGTIETVDRRLALIFPAEARPIIVKFREAKQRANALLDTKVAL